MGKTKKVLGEEIKALWMARFKEMIAASGDDCLVYGSNKLAIPVLDSEGNEEWVTITISVPQGSRDGDSFDGYEMAQDYEMKQKEKAEKKAKAEKEKAKKIARDEKMREEKKRLKEANKKGEE